MVDYSCLRCGYIASQKINLKHHLNRKNVCKPILEDISIEEVKKYYGLKFPQKFLKTPQNLLIFPQKNLLKNPQKILKNPQF